MVQSESLELLLSAARGAMQRDERPRLDRAVASVTDWDAVIELASRNGVIPLIARCLRDHEQVPLSIRRKLYLLYFESCSRNPALTAELHAILAALQGAGIEVLAYKGPALAAMAYPDASLRHAPGDLDLLLHKSDISRAKAVMQAREYRPPSRKTEEHFLEHRYHLHFLRQDPEIQVELHWALTPKYWPFSLDADRLWRQAGHVSLDGGSIRTLNPECTVLALCAHGAKEGWPRLSQIMDLGRVIQAHPRLDWDWLIAEARRMRRQRVLRLGLWLVTELIGVSIPEPAAAEIRQDQEVPTLGLEIRNSLVTGRLSGTDFHSYALRVWHHIGDQTRYLAYLCRLLPQKILTLVKISGRDRDWMDLRGVASVLYVFVRPVRVIRQYRDPRLVVRMLLKNL